MVLGNLPVPGHPTNLGKSRARVVWIFFSRLLVLFSISLSLGDGPI